MTRRNAALWTLVRQLRRLGHQTTVFSTGSIEVSGLRLSGTRARVDSAPWLHLTATTRATAVESIRHGNLLAALTDRVPAVGVVSQSRDEVAYVAMAPWAFAALLRMATQCSPTDQQTALNDYLPLAAELTETDRAIGSGALSALESAGRSSSDTSATDSPSTSSPTC